MAVGVGVSVSAGTGTGTCLIDKAAASCFGRESTSIWTSLLNAVLAIAAIYATYKQYKLLDDQMELARDYYNLALRDSNHYHDHYVPKELMMLSEACSLRRYNPDYVGTQGRMAYATNKQIGLAWNQAKRTADKYNTGQSKDMDVRMAIARAQLATAAITSGYRFEENKKIEMDAIRWERMLNMANIGIKVGAQANAALAAAFSATQQASNNLASFFGTQANAFGSALGYNMFGRPNFLGGNDQFGASGMGLRNFPGGFNGPYGANSLGQPAGINSGANFQIGSGLGPAQNISTYGGGLNSTGFGNTGGISDFGWNSR